MAARLGRNDIVKRILQHHRIDVTIKKKFEKNPLPVVHNWSPWMIESDEDSSADSSGEDSPIESVSDNTNFSEDENSLESSTERFRV